MVGYLRGTARKPTSVALLMAWSGRAEMKTVESVCEDPAKNMG